MPRKKKEIKVPENMLSVQEQEWLKEAKERWIEDRIPAQERKQYLQLASESTGARGGNLENAAFTLFARDHIDYRRLAAYRNGADGFEKWVKEYIRIKIYIKIKGEALRTEWKYYNELPDEQDEHGRSYKNLFDKSLEEVKKSLEIDDYGIFRYKLLWYFWPRGETKSFWSCVIVLWRFFNFMFQRLYVTSLSKDVSQDSLYGEIREILENSPKLYEVIGPGGITLDEIRMNREGKGRFNFIKIISSLTGLKSNASLIIFTEALKSANSQFFMEAYTSLRNIPNTMFIIDSTAPLSDDHWLNKQIFEPWIKDQKTETESLTFISYRSSKNGNPEDYWHPGMDARQIEDFRKNMTAHMFRAYILNLIGSDELKIFSTEEIAAIRYCGIDGIITPYEHEKIVGVLREYIGKEKGKSRWMESDIVKSGGEYWNWDPSKTTAVGRLKAIDDIYSFGEHAIPEPETSIRTGSEKMRLSHLQILGSEDAYNTDFAILVGIDMSSELKTGDRLGARTIVVCVAKGQPGSKGKGRLELLKKDDPKSYFYFLLGIWDIVSHEGSRVNLVLKRIHTEFDGIDMISGEPYQMGEVNSYCNNMGLQTYFKAPSEGRHDAMYKELILAITNGRFKSPGVPISGSKEKDILREELKMIDVAESKGGGRMKYESPQKHKKGGIQDDVLDALTWSIYGGLELTSAHFRERTRKNEGILMGKVYPGMPGIDRAFRGIFNPRWLPK